MAESGFSYTYPLTQQYYTLSYMNTPSFTDGTNHSLSKTLQGKCTTRPYYEISTSQFSDMKIRRLMRKYGFGGYSPENRFLLEYFFGRCNPDCEGLHTSRPVQRRTVQEVPGTYFGGHTAELPEDLLHAFPTSRHIRRAGACGQLIHKTIIHFK